jgi:hypothetical protein
MCFLQQKDEKINTNCQFRYVADKNVVQQRYSHYTTSEINFSLFH